MTQAELREVAFGTGGGGEGPKYFQVGRYGWAVLAFKVEKLAVLGRPGGVILQSRVSCCKQFLGAWTVSENGSKVTPKDNK